jgi:ribosomal protein S18 acetylase RimI-like enzyme
LVKELKGDELMEIKQFKVISTAQRKELYNFIKSTDLTYSKTYIEMIKKYESDIFNDGNGIFVLFNNGKIKGSIAVITKEISIKGEAYVTDIYIENENAEITLGYSMERVVEYCNLFRTESIKIGIRESETHLIQYINKLEFSHIYDAVIMRYIIDKNTALKGNKEMELLPLSILNSHEYVNIQNEAFKNSPNGCTVDEAEVKDYIIKYANDDDLIGICFAQKKPCGIYELSIDENIGWIDTLGIQPIYQKKGLGSALISKCIEKLFDKNLDEIKLLVITSNEVAMNMYKENGFEEEKIFSYWFEKKFRKNGDEVNTVKI